MSEEENENLNAAQDSEQSADDNNVSQIPDPPKDKKKKPSLEEQYEDLRNAHLYLKAEFENYKKNMIKERSELVKFGSERIIHEILSLMDNFSRALEMDVTDKNYKSFKEGVAMAAHEFHKKLEGFGVEEIKADPDTMFDPNLHEAMSSEPTDKAKPGHISTVFKKGYKLHGKVIRAAQVVVAREPDDAKDKEPVEQEPQEDVEPGVLEIDDTETPADNA